MSVGGVNGLLLIKWSSGKTRSFTIKEARKSTHRAWVNNLLSEKCVLSGILVEQAPVHLQVPCKRVARADSLTDDPSVCEWIIERAVVLRAVKVPQRGEQNDEKRRGILSSVHQMRKCLARVSVTPKTLRKTEPSWQAVDDRSNDEIVLHAMRHTLDVRPVAAVGEVKACKELEVHQCGYEWVELVSQPKIGKLHWEEWSWDHSALKLE